MRSGPGDPKARALVLAVSALALLLVASAPAAMAQGPGLPRTYQVERVDSPTAGPSDTFGFGLVNAGDLNGDGKDDLLSGQGTRILNDGTGAEDGELVVISGADGSLIRSIPAPEPDAGCTPTTADRCAAFGFYFGRIGVNATAAPNFTDLGSCPGGDGADADAICDAATVGGPDGIPDIVVSALFVDRASGAAGDGTAEDIGRVYVYDGATFSILKRIDMPQADVDDMADETEALILQSPPGVVRPWFGRTVLNPAGQPPCNANLGVGPCFATPIAVRRGDLDNGGAPDLVVGASAYKYEEAEGTNPACDDTPSPTDTCIRSGRAYMYRGEDIVGSAPSDILSTAAWNMVNPFAQADDPNSRIINQLELFGHSVAPVGDVGRCNAAGAPGTACPPPSVSGAQDGQPEVLVSAFRVDYPTSGPDNDEMFDVGVNLLLDGQTGRILQTYKHPDPDPGSIFGFTIFNQPAVGNMGSTAVPDVFIPAGGQDTDTHRGEGMGFVMNGASAVSGNTIDIQRFRDPVPNTSGSFGTTAAGVGDLVGNPLNEILIGEFPTHNPPQNDQVISDVHFFDPVTGAALQTIPDPDQQPVSSFGLGIAPLGDLNTDGFLDFAVGAGRYDPTPTTLDVGRVYIFRSDNSPLPAPPAAPPPAGRAPAPGAPAPVPTLAGCAAGKRLLSLTSGNDSVNGSAGADLIFAGAGDDVVDALAGDDCVDLGPGADRGQGGAGNDLILGGLGADRISGGSGNDRLRGNPGDDRLNGGRGNDRLIGDSGDDRISGSFGDDRIHGVAGRDRIAGSRGRDRINGGKDSDRISGGSSGDVIRGDQGSDRINGNSGSDRISGNSGNDRISGGSGNDRIGGGAGNDRIGGGAGRDRVSAGAGNDRIDVRDGRRDRVSCGSGRDRVRADSADVIASNCERVSVASASAARAGAARASALAPDAAAAAGALGPAAGALGPAAGALGPAALLGGAWVALLGLRRRPRGSSVGR